VSYKVRLTKIKSNHNNIRTSTVEGVTYKLPEVGDTFTLFAEPLDPHFDLRGVYTTEVKLVERIGNEFQFSTANSTYKLELLEEVK